MIKIFVVIDDLITDENSWETHLASLLQGYVESSNIDCIVQEIRNKDLSTIKTYFQTGYIEPQDKFIFPNSWTSMTSYIRHWSENYNKPVEMIGFWSRGCYLNEDSEYRPLNDRNWRKVHERASFRCLDKSFFISEYHKEQFRIYVSKHVFPERLNVIQFPLDYLDLEMSKYTSDYFKQNMLIFPWHKYSDLHEQIMYDYIRVYKDIQIIFAQEKSPLERHQLLSQISKAKVAFLPYDSPRIGKEIYECFLLGTIPLVPDIEGLRDLVPEAFRYPPEWTENIFNYSKYAPDLTSKIKELVYHYDDYKPLIKEQREYLYVNFYDSQKIIEQIFDNTNRN
jgi:hypothetical protein